MKVRASRHSVRRVRPHLETLEDRCMPATPVWSFSPPLLTLTAGRRMRRQPARRALVTAAAQEHFLLRLTTDLRRRSGLAVLTFDGSLAEAARTQAQALASLGGLPVEGTVHAASGGDVGGRARAAGYAWSSVAENVFSTNDRKSMDVLLTRAVRSWLASSTHRLNLLDPAFREVGLGVARSADGFLHVVAVFGSRS